MPGRAKTKDKSDRNATQFYQPARADCEQLMHNKCGAAVAHIDNRVVPSCHQAARRRRHDDASPQVQQSNCASPAHRITLTKFETGHERLVKCHHSHFIPSMTSVLPIYRYRLTLYNADPALPRTASSPFLYLFRHFPSRTLSPASLPRLPITVGYPNLTLHALLHESRTPQSLRSHT